MFTNWQERAGSVFLNSARETQSWLETAVECEYITQKVGKELFELYHEIIGKLINMENNPDEWVLKTKK